MAQEEVGYGRLSLLLDVDEAILRGNPHTHKHDKYLVKLDELVNILGGTPKNDILEFERKKPPAGGFEFLDDRRKNSMKILASDSAVQTTFVLSFSYLPLDFSGLAIVEPDLPVGAYTD